MDTEFMRGWLRGFFDGEGCAVLARYGKGRRSVETSIRYGNTDKVLIDTATEYLDAFGISCKVYKRPYLTRVSREPRINYEIRITRKHDLLRFSEVVGTSSPAKAEKIRAILEYRNSHRDARLDLPRNERGQYIRQ